MSRAGVSQQSKSWTRHLAAVHDFITHVGFIISAVCLAGIVFSFCYEVVARYFFAAPTSWANSLVSYLLCVLTFLVLPELTRQKIHIFISVLPDALPSRYATALIRGTFWAGMAACLFATWFTFDATLVQYVRGISTINEWRIPKWIVSITIPYGLLSTGIYFFRQAISKESYQVSGVPLT